MSKKEFESINAELLEALKDILGASFNKDPYSAEDLERLFLPIISRAEQTKKLANLEARIDWAIVVCKNPTNRKRLHVLGEIDKFLDEIIVELEAD